jgi:hypothetical protein
MSDASSLSGLRLEGKMGLSFGVTTDTDLVAASIRGMPDQNAPGAIRLDVDDIAVVHVCGTAGPG